MKESAIARIENILKEEDFTTYLMPMSEDNLFERLFVALDNDKQSCDYTLQIHFINDVTNVLGVEDQVEDAYILQFLLIFPYQCTEKATFDLCKAMALLNLILPIGTFSLSVDERIPYFQYNLICPDRGVNKRVLLEAIGITSFFVNEFAERLKQVSDGKLTATQFKSDLEATGLTFPQLGAGMPQPSDALA